MVDSEPIEIVDLPGTYSLTAYTQEELVARNFLVDERPEVIIDVMNADALERNLYLAVQIMELGVPLVLGLNMMDEVRTSGKKIDSERLASLSGCVVVETVARSSKGTDALLKASIKLAKEKQGEWNPLNITYGPDLDPVLDEMEKMIEAANFLTDKVPARWTAIKYMERDEDVVVKGRMTNSDLSSKMEDMAREIGEHTQKIGRASCRERV